MEKKAVTEVKFWDINEGRFHANGKEYIVSQHMAIERYALYQELEPELGFGARFKDIYDNIGKALDFINNMKFVDAVVILKDTQRGMSKVKEKEPIVLKICALFINVVGEDVTNVSDDMISEKIKDWKAEGLSPLPFFQLAVTTLDGFKQRYETLTRSTSALKEAAENLRRAQA